ncbi:MAG TPA: DUF4276 family protein [Candidatus Sumerlaeota bacterium]|nr:DUF4276 family protein [Candidatus Sumerlaeota bacterium]HPS03089.1 DUF4276 family protein [Candidatus Sumerlaeota bacterium]
MKFVLLVEGQTEKDVLPKLFSRWLNPQLGQSVKIQTIPFRGWPEFEKSFARKALDHLNGPRAQDIIAVIGLLDLYLGGNQQASWSANVSDTEEKVKRGRAHFNSLAEKEGVPQDRFHMFFAVHELEAWLLSQPDIFPQEIAKALPGRVPEEVNSDEPPSKLLTRLYREKSGSKKKYNKITDGSNLFAKLDPDQARKKCPHLKEMLDTLLDLARREAA